VAQLNPYQRIISEATGVTDAADLQEIENALRDEFRCLDRLSRECFIEQARYAWKLIQWFRSPAGAAEVEEIMAEMGTRS